MFGRNRRIVEAQQNLELKRHKQTEAASAYIAALENSGEKKDAVIANLEEQVRAAEAVIASLKNVIAEQENVLETANREIVSLRSQLTEET